MHKLHHNKNIKEITIRSGATTPRGDKNSKPKPSSK